MHFPKCSALSLADTREICTFHRLLPSLLLSTWWWAKMVITTRRSPESQPYFHLLSWLGIKSIQSLLGVNFVCRRSQQNPVFANLQSTRPGDNTSLLWLHIKIQKGMSLRVYSLCIKSITCIHSSIVFKMSECGAGLVFLGIKSIHWSHNPSAPLCSMSNRFLKHSSKCMVYSMRHNDTVQCVQKLNTQNVCVCFFFFFLKSVKSSDDSRLQKQHLNKVPTNWMVHQLDYWTKGKPWHHSQYE